MHRRRQRRWAQQRAASAGLKHGDLRRPVNLARNADTTIEADEIGVRADERMLTVVDVFTKEALAIEVGQRLRGEHVVSALNRIAARRGAPRHIFVDNGSEFSGRLLDMWAYHHKSKIDFSRPGKPTDNCHIETFNGSFRDECLNLHWFETLDEAKATIEAWRGHFNESGPYSALQELAPAEFAR